MTITRQRRAASGGAERDVRLGAPDGVDAAPVGTAGTGGAVGSGDGGYARAAEDDETCEDFIPLFLRRGAAADPDAVALRRDEYRRSLRRLRWTFAAGWLVLLACWVLALVVPSGDVDEHSFLAVSAALAFLCLPIVLVVILPCVYVVMRRRTRVEDLEAHPETDIPDRFPADRLVRPGGTLGYAVTVAICAAVLAALAWAPMVLDEVLTSGETAVGWAASALVLVIVVVVGVRAARVGVVGTPDALVATTVRGRTAVPWGDLREVRVELVEVAVQHGTNRTLQLAIVGRGLPHPLTWQLGVGSKAGRVRARHNIAVASAWTRDHGLEAGEGLADAQAWAAGDVSLPVLERSARPVSGSAR